jgi:hypothetical protein
MSTTATNPPAAVVVRRFLEVVRSGRHPDDAHHANRGSTKPVTELAACTYRVDSGRIVEYWLLIDRLGIERQLAA